MAFSFLVFTVTGQRTENSERDWSSLVLQYAAQLNHKDFVWEPHFLQYVGYRRARPHDKPNTITLGLIVSGRVEMGEYGLLHTDSHLVSFTNTLISKLAALHFMSNSTVLLEVFTEPRHFRLQDFIEGVFWGS